MASRCNRLYCRHNPLRSQGQTLVSKAMFAPKPIAKRSQVALPIVGPSPKGSQMAFRLDRAWLCRDMPVCDNRQNR
jgi:hypothetical protein